MARLNCVTILAPAKLNLALDVVGLLPGGYHDLDMTMHHYPVREGGAAPQPLPEPASAGQSGGPQ